MIRGGKSYVSAPPAFSNDARRLLVCTGNTVSVFSTSTGLQVSSLEGHTALVTSVIVEPASSPDKKILCNCWTASLDGTIRKWDFSTPELLQTVDIQLPIFSMVIPSYLLSQSEEINAKTLDTFAYVSVEDKKAANNRSKALCGQIRKCNLTKSQMSKLILKETKRPQSLITSPSGKFFGIKNKRRLHIWQVPTVDSNSIALKSITLHHTKAFSCLAFHPVERIVAAGDESGRILIWRGFGTQKFFVRSGIMNSRSADDEGDKPGVRDNDDAESCSTWHWHPAGVMFLSFSSDGAYLYSGGKEGVLVVWQLDTGKKKFLPRIGSPLLYFIDSPDPSLASISCADNQIHVLKMPSMEILRSISGIKPPLSSKDICGGLAGRPAFDCNSGLVAVQTENYTIQFYSLLADRGLYEVQVCERNHQPGDEVTVVVALVELSLDGTVMGTVEVKLPEEDIGGLICLKFWELDSDDKIFTVSTLIYEPHRDAQLSAIAFHPTRHMAVSSSYGGDFKIWVSKHETKQNDQKTLNSGWTCHAVGSYKDKPMTAAAFSADGSVLAVAAETVITLWDPDKNTLVAVVGQSPTPIVSLTFAGNSDCLLYASHGSKPRLGVLSMSKLAECWSYRIQVEAVSYANDLSLFAILALLPESNERTFGGDGIILLFNATDPVPVTSLSVTKAKGGRIAFIKGDPYSLELDVHDGNPSQTLLAYISGDREYVLFDPYGKEIRELSITRRDDPSLEETGQYGYASLYGKLPEFNLKKSSFPLISSAAPSEKPWEAIFPYSTHSLPQLDKLCSEFLESVTEKRTATAE
ncbi:WD repeat-containing protein 75-like [Neltuma alba]|uniref:WD repeat-containing protein 75-like n=1 Tax=Neltuma alba TaxID=207710 RepID=UPI0010A4C5ED|nr:WD repeat-containing protein 75-like [Prosopis alba]